MENFSKFRKSYLFKKEIQFENSHKIFINSDFLYIPFKTNLNDFVFHSFDVLSDLYNMKKETAENSDYKVFSLFIPYCLYKIRYTVNWSAKAGWFKTNDSDNYIFVKNKDSSAVCGKFSGTNFYNFPLNNKIFSKDCAESFMKVDFSGENFLKAENGFNKNSLLVNENSTCGDNNNKTRKMFETDIKYKLDGYLQEYKYKDLVYDRTVEEDAKKAYLPFRIFECAQNGVFYTVISDGANIKSFTQRK